MAAIKPSRYWLPRLAATVSNARGSSSTFQASTICRGTASARIKYQEDVTLTPVRMRPEMRPPRETRLNEFPGQGMGRREIAHVEGQEGAAFEVRGPVGSTVLCGECIESTEGVVRRREVAGPQLQSGRAAEERSERDQGTRLLRQALRFLEQGEVGRRQRARR